MRRAGILLLVAGLLVSPFLAAPSSGQLPWQNYAQDWLSDRYLDPTFGTGGKLMTGHRVNGAGAMALQKDGKILVGTNGLFGTNVPMLLRLLPNGAYDPTFAAGANGTRVEATGEYYPPRIRSLAVQEDGKILVAGEVSQTQPSASSLLTESSSDFY
ncbi:MAG: delta-60 repeat domain-containing protein, partial [Actinomycetota bacterium]